MVTKAGLEDALAVHFQAYNHALLVGIGTPGYILS